VVRDQWGFKTHRAGEEGQRGRETELRALYPIMEKWRGESGKKGWMGIRSNKLTEVAFRRLGKRKKV